MLSRVDSSLLLNKKVVVEEISDGDLCRIDSFIEQMNKSFLELHNFSREHNVVGVMLCSNSLQDKVTQSGLSWELQKELNNALHYYYPTMEKDGVSCKNCGVSLDVYYVKDDNIYADLRVVYEDGVYKIRWSERSLVGRYKDVLCIKDKDLDSIIIQWKELSSIFNDFYPIWCNILELGRGNDRCLCSGCVSCDFNTYCSNVCKYTTEDFQNSIENLWSCCKVVLNRTVKGSVLCGIYGRAAFTCWLRHQPAKFSIDGDAVEEQFCLWD